MLDFPGPYEEVVGSALGQHGYGRNTAGNPKQDVGFFKYPAGEVF